MIVEVFAREAVTERPFSVELAAEDRLAERGLETVLVQRPVILAFAADEQFVSHSEVDAVPRLIDGDRRPPETERVKRKGRVCTCGEIVVVAISFKKKKN